MGQKLKGKSIRMPLKSGKRSYYGQPGKEGGSILRRESRAWSGRTAMTLPRPSWRGLHKRGGQESGKGSDRATPKIRVKREQKSEGFRVRRRGRFVTRETERERGAPDSLQSCGEALQKAVRGKRLTLGFCYQKIFVPERKWFQPKKERVFLSSAIEQNEKGQRLKEQAGRERHMGGGEALRCS